MNHSSHRCGSILSQPRLILEPPFNKRVHIFERGFIDGTKVPNEVDEVAVLGPHGGEVLSLAVTLNALKFGLEAESISHLIEQEGQEELSPALIEGQEPRTFVIVHLLHKGVAVGDGIRNGAVDHSSCIQVEEEVSVDFSGALSLVVVALEVAIVSLIVDGEH